jgi:integrase
MIDSDLCRGVVNQRTQRLVRMIGWGVAEALVPPQVHWGLKALVGLKKGRCEAREGTPIKSVPDADVDEIEPFVPAQIWAMIQLQRLSGMRLGQVCIMRTCDLDTSGRTWVFAPQTHKTEHDGKGRSIYLGPGAREILRLWLRTELTAYLFSPREVMEQKHARQRECRKSPVTPSQRARKRKSRPKRTPGERYNTRSYQHAILYGIRQANRKLQEAGRDTIPTWSPNQLRKNAATRLRREFDLDVARAVLGHSSPVVTAEHYAELDGAKAADAMERIG